MTGWLIGAAAVGTATGFAIGWLAQRARLAAVAERLEMCRARLAAVEGEAAESRAGLASAREQIARMEAEQSAARAAADEKLAIVEQARTSLLDAFKALSAEALQANAASFLQLAQEKFEALRAMSAADLDQRRQAVEGLVAPLREELAKYENAVKALDREREGAYRGLLEQVRSMREGHDRLRHETESLVRALRTPQTRGRWGEIQLRRVVEMAGMIEHCDFEEQTSVAAEDGRLRPDMIVHLPEGRQVVVDAKAPLTRYLDAVAAVDDSERAEHLRQHARCLRDHLRKLSQKAYWEEFDPAPDFVIMFLPGEAFLSAAFQQDPALIEDGFAARVIIATPTILIGLLKTIAYGWRQQAMAENAQRVADAGRELYRRMAKLLEHLAAVGHALNAAVAQFNRCAGSLESRLLPCVRQFETLGVVGGAGPPPEVAAIDVLARDVGRLADLPAGAANETAENQPPGDEDDGSSAMR